VRGRKRGERKNIKGLECAIVNFQFTIANFRKIVILKGLLEHQNC
jgi:hypothetical protein